MKVFKIGGNITDNPEALMIFLKEFSEIGGDKILVHGGGKESTRMSAKLGIETTMINGRRVTSRETLDVVTMVYAGLVNKRIVSMLQALGVNALGLSGADGNAIKATRRPAEPIDFGYVGDITPEGVNSKFLKLLIDNDIVPVICAINHDGNGTLLNCNADSVASAVAKAMSKKMPTELIFCFEQNGVLRDINDTDSVVELITPELYHTLKECGVINGGMIPKVENALDAVEYGVREVRIRGSRDIADGSGTRIVSCS